MDIIAMATKILLQKTQRCKINFRMKLKGNTFLHLSSFQNICTAAGNSLFFYYILNQF
jgi:hypothetical protein